MKDESAIFQPTTLAVLPLEDTVLFPGAFTQLVLKEKGAIQLVRQAKDQERPIAIVGIRRPIEGYPHPEDLHNVGTAVTIHRILKLPENQVQVILRGVKRISIQAIVQHAPHLVARVEPLTEIEEKSAEERALTRNLSQQFQAMVKLAPNLDDGLQIAVVNLEDQPVQLSDFIASGLELSIEEKQQLLEELVVEVRLRQLALHIQREVSVLEMGRQIQSQVQEEVGQAQREHYLREQMRVIQNELNGGRDDDVEELRQQIAKAGLSEEARDEAERELGRLAQMAPGSAEAPVVRTYLDWLLGLPWKKAAREKIDLSRAQKILDQDHQGLDKIKERVLEYMAVRKLRRDSKGPIFCFVGPPGVGKTSLGRSIARALGRKFGRIALGGVRDEAEIRGHRRTYVGALPGRVIQSLNKTGTNNPVLLLDEIDKVGADFRGDPAAALLEVLDPEQNHSFVDHYLGVAFDLSKAIFIATANQLDTIPPALQDRMEVIQLSGYTEDEKVKIARSHLIPRQLKENGLSRRKIDLADETIRALIRDYTREAGLRNLEREIGRIFRKIARNIVEGKKGRPRVAVGDLPIYLGPGRSQPALHEKEPTVGIVAGLAWTPVGGEVLYVEATRMKGSKGLVLTGQLGDVMRESAQIALSYVRAQADQWDIEPDFFDGQDFHVHFPAGAIPKDGPSAGVTVATAFLSLVSGRPVRQDVAMTGEISLRGRVLPVGGIKEKVLAAYNAGLKTVILPKYNEKDLQDLPVEVRQQLEIVLVEHLTEVFQVGLEDTPVRKAA